VKNRFNRDLEVDDPSEVVLTRFQHLTRESDLVDARILAGGFLEASAEKNRIFVLLHSNFLSGRYPSFHIGLLSLGEALQGDPFESDVPGECSGIDPIDQALLGGSTLTVEKLGSRLQATWIRSLPYRTFKYEGKEHRVYRQGARKAKGTKIIETATVALQEKELVIEGSLLAVD